MQSSSKIKADIPTYGGIPGGLLQEITKLVSSFGFAYERSLMRGVLFSRPDRTALVVDHDICDGQYGFEYSFYSDEQNELMYEYVAVYRTVVDGADELPGLGALLCSVLGAINSVPDCVPAGGANREVSSIDPTLPEAHFEQAFINVFGRESLDFLCREYPVMDLGGHNRYIDYYLERESGNVAIEKNGVTYHHPQLIGKKKYLGQLLKQNSLVAQGTRVYRWALENMKFKERFHEDLRRYLGQAADFKHPYKLNVSRQFRLLPHQGDALATIQSSRAAGASAALVVLPTGTGKTEILIADYAALCKELGFPVRGLMLVPQVQLKLDMIKAFKRRLGDYSHLPADLTVGEGIDSTVIVQTYAWAIRRMHEIDAEEFKYVGVDEAHHSVAPTLRKLIQRLNPVFMLGLTATDQRLDEAKLEDVFGKYESKLSLVDAIKNGLLAPIKAFRLESNVDLSEVRFNGKDFVNADLGKSILVPSRNQLIVDVVQKYFVDSEIERKSGLIFCVNVKHAETMAADMRARGISAESVSGTDSKSAGKIARYQAGEIQFLATCSLLSEGWDSPRTSVIVMARPTMSKVLYTQQLGRGTRKYEGKSALYVIDVVDNYGASGTNRPWSLHAILGCTTYMPWSNPLSASDSVVREETILAGLYESERALREIDIFTFEYRYPNFLSDEQIARELFVSTDTLKGWVKKGRLMPSVSVPFGAKRLNYYDPEGLEQIRKDLGLQVHDETTQYDDFFEFLEARDYSRSYKMVMMLGLLALANEHGECGLDVLAASYAKFYEERIRAGLPADRDEKAGQQDLLQIWLDLDEAKRNLLRNPFEKFERKRFMYQCKDLNKIAFSTALWQKLTAGGDLERIQQQMFDDLTSYYENLGGLTSEARRASYWS